MLGGLELNGNLYTEFMGYNEEIYSIFHCDLYTISIVQDSNGKVVAISYETDGEPVEEL